MSIGSFLSGAIKVGSALFGSALPVTTAVSEFKQGNVGRGVASLLAPGIGSAIVGATSAPAKISEGFTDEEAEAQLQQSFDNFGEKLGKTAEAIGESLAEKYGFSDLISDDSEEVQPNVPQDHSASLLPAVGVFGSLAMIARFLL